MFTLLLMPFGSTAAEEANVSITKKYPPYPDIWGYDFSDYPAAQESGSMILGHKMNNGDYWFKVRRVSEIEGDKNRKAVKAKFNLIKFFEGTTKELSDREKENLIKIMNRNNDIDGSLNKVTFSNGDTLEFEDDTPSATYCYLDSLYGSKFIKRDKDGKILGRYSIIMATSDIQTMHDDNMSEECGPSAEDGNIHLQLYPIFGGMVMLEDDTFLLSGNYNIIARFDQNLKTKFDSKVKFKTRDGRTLYRNLFVIPYEFIESLIHVLTVTDKPISQGIHDGIMDYIMADLNNLNR